MRRRLDAPSETGASGIRPARTQLRPGIAEPRPVAADLQRTGRFWTHVRLAPGHKPGFMGSAHGSDVERAGVDHGHQGWLSGFNARMWWIECPPQHGRPARPGVSYLGPRVRCHTARQVPGADRRYAP